MESGQEKGEGQNKLPSKGGREGGRELLTVREGEKMAICDGRKEGKGIVVVVDSGRRCVGSRRTHSSRLSFQSSPSLLLPSSLSSCCCLCAKNGKQPSQTNHSHPHLLSRPPNAPSLLHTHATTQSIPPLSSTLTAKSKQRKANAGNGNEPLSVVVSEWGEGCENWSGCWTGSGGGSCERKPGWRGCSSGRMATKYSSSRTEISSDRFERTSGLGSRVAK